MSMQSPMKLAMVATSLSRKAGGLFYSVRFLSLALADAGHEVIVFGLRDEHSDEDISAWSPLSTTLLDPVGPKALGFSPDLKSALLDADADLVHQHGIWQAASYSISAWRRETNRPVVISPRGMLDPWALGQARLKKAVVRALYERGNLHKAAAIHALNVSEEASVRGYGLSQTVASIPNGTDLPDLSISHARPGWAKPNRKILFFLGRLHPKKGLEPLLHAWAALKTSCPEIHQTWQLAIAGWDDGGHEADLHQQTDRLELGDSVVFTGPLFADDKAAALAHSGAFILPSHSEGMPMSVLEAWSYGLPVIMTEACNIPAGFDAKAAMRITTEPASIEAALKALLPDSSARAKIGRAGRDLVERQFTWSVIANQMIDLYREVI